MVDIPDRIGVVLVGTDGVPYEASGSGVSQTDGSAFTPNTSSMVPVGGLYESTPSAVSDGDAGTLGMTANRVLKAALHNASGAAITTLPVSMTSTTITGTVAVTQSGTWDEVGINDSGNSITVDNGGTFAVQAAGDVAAGASDSGNPVKAGGRYNSTKPTLTDGQRGDLQLGSRGSLQVQLMAADGITQAGLTNGNSDAISNTNFVGPYAIAGMHGYNGTNWDRLRSDTTNGLDVDVTRLPALVASTAAIGKLAANSGVDIGDVDVTSIAAGTNLIGDVGIQPRTSNGLTTFMASGSDGSSILVATAQVIKASAGQLYGYYAFNPEAATTFVHFYNTAAASVTVGTTNPLFTLAIPAGAAANLMNPLGITFSNAGWSCAATTTAGGNTAPATGVSLVAWYA